MGVQQEGGARLDRVARLAACPGQSAARGAASRCGCRMCQALEVEKELLQPKRPSTLLSLQDFA